MVRSKKKKAEAAAQRAASAATNNPGLARGGQSIIMADVSRRAHACLQERPALDARYRDAIRDATAQINRARSELRRLHLQIVQEYEMESQREAQIDRDREAEAQRQQEQVDRDREHAAEMRIRREQSAYDRARTSRARSQQVQSARDRDRDHDAEMRRRREQSAHARARFPRATSRNPSRQASRPPNRPDRHHTKIEGPSAQSKETKSTDRTQNEVPKQVRIRSDVSLVFLNSNENQQPHIGTLPSASRFADVLQRQNEALRTEGLLLSRERTQDPALKFDAAALRVMESIGFNGDAFRTLEEDATVSVSAARPAQPTAHNVSPMRRDDEPRKVASRFGEPQKPIPGFERIMWVRPQPEAIANYVSSNERSLEDIYRDHPEKKLRGLEPETLGLVGTTVHQIAQEAANNWLKLACPGTRWNDSIINVDGICKYGMAT